MAGTKQQASIEDLKKLLSNFKEYEIIGNKPYAKGVYIIRTGKSPRIVQEYSKNYEAFKAMITPGWTPEKSNNEYSKLFQTEQLNTSGHIDQMMLRNMLKRAIDLGLEFQELVGFFHINPFDPEVITQLRNQLK